jgi:serine/threonine protein kinase
LIGQALGHYRFDEKIGAGGMGEVYRAFDHHLERDVAIKVLPTGTLQDDVARKRFRKEAIALSRINHPSIATVHDFDTIKGIDFLVMELVPGRTLREIIKAGPIDADIVHDLAVQLANALDAAHRGGVIHRDLKPGNIKVTPDGQLKVLDFGLAKLFKQSGETQDRVTESSVQAGTLAYMSPEQVTGDRITEASDLFSYGTVLYEMLAGQHPFEADHSHSVVYNILNSTPPLPSSIRSNVRRYDGIVERLLEKKPLDRYASARDVLSDLTRTLDRPVGRAKRRRPSALTTGVLIGAVVTVVLFSLMAFLKGTPDTLALYSTGTIRQLTFTGTANVPNWSPDGKHIAYLDGPTIKLIPPEGGAPRTLETGQINALAWEWMPDGSAILGHGRDPVSKSIVILKIGLYGEETQTLVENGLFPAVSPDQKFLLYMSTAPESSRQLWRLELETGESAMLVTPPEEGTTAYKPRWSPDGSLISYIRWNGAGHELWVMKPDSSLDRRVDTGPLKIGGQYAWGPGGQSFFISGELHGIWSIWRISLESGEPPLRLTANPTMDYHVSVAPDGERFAFGRKKDVSRVVVIGESDSALTYPIEMSVANRHPVYAADGSALYFQVMVNSRWQIWKATPDKNAGDPKPVVSTDDMSCFQVTRGEGNDILFIMGSYGYLHRWGRIGWSQTLWTASADGAQRRQLKGAGERVQRIAGQGYRAGRILYSANDAADYEVFYVLQPDGTPLEIFRDGTDGYCGSLDWGRADNEVILACSADSASSRTNHLKALNIESMEYTTLLVADSLSGGLPAIFHKLAVTPDGSKVSFVLWNSRGRALYIHNFVNDTTRSIYKFGNKENPDHITWSPEGSSIAIDIHKETNDIFVWEPLADQLASK